MAKQTTVLLTEKAQKIKDANIRLGLKGILSVGLELFDELSPQEKYDRVDKAMKADQQAKKDIEYYIKQGETVVAEAPPEFRVQIVRAMKELEAEATIDEAEKLAKKKRKGKKHT